MFYAAGKLTDVGRAMKTLGVEMIFAHSPQAKGRVERTNRTYQDRFISNAARELQSPYGLLPFPRVQLEHQP